MTKILKTINNRIEGPAIRNLAFQGGGPRGIAYVGALKELEAKIGKEGFAKIERVAGTSAGAITAALLSVGYTPEELRELLEKKNLIDFILTGEEGVDKLIMSLAKNLSKVLGNPAGDELENNLNREKVKNLIKIFNKLLTNTKFTNFILNADDDTDKLISQLLENLATSSWLEIFKSILQAPRSTSSLLKTIYDTGAFAALWELYSAIKPLLPVSDIKTFDDVKKSLLQSPKATYSLLKNISERGGICNGEAFRTWMEKSISDKIKGIENSTDTTYDNLTFEALDKLQKAKPDKYKKLFIIGGSFDTDNKVGFIKYSTEKAEYKNHIISDAVRISMSIPFLFAPHDPHYLDCGVRKKRETATALAGGVDGGAFPLTNYPVWIFDNNKYLSEPDLTQTPDAEISNYETLGFTLYDKKKIGPMDLFERSCAILDINSDISKKNLAQLMQSQSSKKLLRDVAIDTHNVTMLDFDLENERKEKLQKSGSASVKAYWTTDRRGLSEEYAKIKPYKRITNDLARKKYMRLDNLSDNVDRYQVPHQYALKSNSGYSIKDVLEFSNEREKNQVEITGVAGSGKTQLALYAADQYFEARLQEQWKNSKHGLSLEDSKNGPIIWIIDAETENSLLTSMQKLAKRLGLPLYESLSELYESIFAELKTCADYLLIFDNLESKNRKLIEYCLKNIHTQGVILITTQDKTPKDYMLGNCEYADLDDGLSPDAAKKLVQEILGSHSELKDAELNLLIERFYNLPLALTVTAFYLKKNNESIENYLALWDSKNPELLKAQEELAKDSRSDKALLVKKQTQGSAVTMSINMIKDDAKSVSLLMLCSCLGTKIPMKLLQDLSGNINLKALIEALREHALIRAIDGTTKNEEEIIMHRFVQEVGREHYKTQLTIDWYDSLLEKMHKIKEDGVKGEHDYYKKQYLLPHLEAIFDKDKIAIPLERFSPGMIRGYIDLGLLYKAIGAAERAVTHYEKILPWIENNKHTCKDVAVEFYLGLGRAYQGGPGDFNKAKEYSQQAFEVHSKEKNPKLAEILNDLSMACHDTGERLSKEQIEERTQNFNQALEYIKQAVEIASELPGQEANLVRYKSNLGKIYRQLKQFDKAEESINSAIEIGAAEFKEKAHRSMAAAYFSLGKVYLSKGKYSFVNNEPNQAQGYFTLAKEKLTEAVEISVGIYGESHPLIARYTDALGKSCRKLGDEGRACENFTKAATILNASRGAQKQLKEKIANHVASCNGGAEKLKLKL